MFEQYADYFWVGLFAALVFYGLWQTVSAPFLVRKFYQKIDFTDQGKSALDQGPYRNSVLLDDLISPRVYVGSYKNFRLEQFAAHPSTRHKFTMSRVQRKRNQAMWTITVLHCEKPLMPLCARPTNVTDAIEYVLRQDNIPFPEDEAFEKRVHVMADDHDKAKEALSPAVREYLNNIDPVSIETKGSVLIHKSPRQPHDVGNKLRSDIEAVIQIYQHWGEAGEQPAQSTVA